MGIPIPVKTLTVFMIYNIKLWSYLYNGDPYTSKNTASLHIEIRPRLTPVVPEQWHPFNQFCSTQSGALVQDWLNGHQWWLISGTAYSEIYVEIDREIEVKISIEIEDLCAAHLFISRTWISNYILHDIVVCIYLSMPQIPAYFTQISNPMMTSSNGNIFRVTGLLCGEFTSRRLIPHTKASDAELWCFLWSAPE